MGGPAGKAAAWCKPISEARAEGPTPSTGEEARRMQASEPWAEQALPSRDPTLELTAGMQRQLAGCSKYHQQAGAGQANFLRLFSQSIKERGM